MKLKLPKWIWFALVLALVLLAAGVLFFATREPVYQTTSIVLITRKFISCELGEDCGYWSLPKMDEDIPITFCDILTSKQTKQSAADTLDLDRATLQDYQVNCRPLPDSTVLVLEVVGSDPVVAIKLNQAIGDEVIASGSIVDNSETISYEYELDWLDKPSNSKRSLMKLQQARRKIRRSLNAFWDDFRSFLGL